MNDQTDQQLLRDYAERHSEAAFAIIVQRYVDLVYSVAFRMICDAHAAKDVTQGVFVALAQNARQLTDRPALAGWLHCTARNLATKAVRLDVRRRAREQEAVVMNELLSANPDVSWENIAPHLDDALSESASNQVAGLSYENQRLNSNTGEFLRLRREVVQLKAATNHAFSLNTSNNPMVTEIEFWLSRVETIKQRLSIQSEKQIPEFQFMPEREWMMVAQYMNIETNLDDVVDIARNYAKKNCELAFHEGLQKYMSANDRKFPPDLNSLQPYLPRLSDPSVFQNYQITPAMIKTETDPDNGVERQAYRPCQATTNSEWIIMQKASLYDSDTQVVVTSSGLRYQNFPTK